MSLTHLRSENYKITSQKIPLIKKGFPIPKARLKFFFEIFSFDFVEFLLDKIVQCSITLAL
jgi:hypothetical protein